MGVVRPLEEGLLSNEMETELQYQKHEEKGQRKNQDNNWNRVYVYMSGILYEVFKLFLIG